MTTPDSSFESFSSPADFFSGVDLSSVPAWETANELAALSIAAFAADQDGDQQSRGVIRLHGDAVENHSIPVRTTIRVLGALQDLVAAVATALRGEPAGLRGRIPEVARAATELRLVAEPLPGSLVLKFAAGPTDTASDPRPALWHEVTLADRSMHRLIDLIREADPLDREQLLSELRPLGPRVARQLVKLAEAVIDDEVLLDLSWQEAGRATDRAAVRRSTAVALRDAITEARVDVDRTTLVGVLQTVSQVRALDLLLDNGDRITLEASDDVRADLGPMYNHRVEVLAEVRVRTSGTGQDRARYQLISVRSLEEED
ncbi:hypothetical protein [Amycolatopsis sp. ATCC 39116]|uniref:hypothetical protein n=1 Tax=Amycolatopsis sp. (strain ATCC 39116 / 75iv2) TaxID=385957 RepID=UPI00026288DF|nr:hypothetical protein [Amycolatopsis sp. ATCC 39116]